MKKIVLIGPARSGKTTLAMHLTNSGKFIHETSTQFDLDFALRWHGSICFDAVHDSEKTEIIKRTLTRSYHYYLETVVCCWQERPEWLTKEFCKDNDILVFNLNKSAK